MRQTLKKNALKPHLRKQWVIPPSEDAEFVSCMERVLDVYQKPFDMAYPIVNMDEQSVQLLYQINLIHIVFRFHKSIETRHVAAQCPSFLRTIYTD